jgi:uncharacterized protein involved in exopolysaccharide biosynthesis
MIKKRRLVGVVFFTVLSLILATYFFLPKTYKATAYIGVTPGGIASFLSFSIDETKSDKPASLMIMHAELVKSRKILEYYLKAANDNPLWKGRKLVMSDLYETFVTEVVPGSHVLKLTVYDTDPALAKNGVDMWVDVYMSYLKTMLTTELTESTNIINNEVELTKLKLLEFEREKKDFTELNKLDLLKEEMKVCQDQLAKIYSEKINKAAEKNINTIVTGGIKVAHSETAGCEHPPLIEKEKAVLEHIAGISAKLSSKKVELAKMQREIDLQVQTISRLSRVRDDMRSKLAFQRYNITVLSYAKESVYAYRPKIHYLIILSIFIGIFLSAFVAFIVEYYERGKMRAASTR